MGLPEDLEGTVINFTVPAEAGADASKLQNGVLTGHTASHALPLQTMIGSLGGRTGRQFKPSGGIWNFTWLKFVPGWVTIAPLTAPVLTGPMSGCYLFSYMDGAQQYVAHVGTSAKPSSDESIAVKKAWRAFIGRPGVSNVTGADPFALFSNEEILRPRGKLVPPSKVVGYFDGAGVGWAMTIGQVTAANGLNPLPGVSRVEMVKPMPLAKWSTVALTEKFKD
jgi:hypothetical protein